MSDDYGKSAAAPTPIVLNGVRYLVAKQGPRIYGELTQFLKGSVPDPRLKAAEILAKIPPDSTALKDVALAIWREFSDEAKDWPPTLDSFEGNQILTMTRAGAYQVIWSLLRRHNPALTPEKAGDLADDLTNDQIAELIRLSMPERAFDPKSPGTPTETDRGPVPV